jgi:hypothetical protein
MTPGTNTFHDVQLQVAEKNHNNGEPQLQVISFQSPRLMTALTKRLSEQKGHQAPCMNVAG